VPASLPYFVPLPPGIGLFGTMGAVILQSRTTDRRKLIDIGAAGPLAGLVVAIPVLAYGLHLSQVGPIAGGLQEGNSLLYAILKRLVCGAWLPDGNTDVNLHPMAFAGWAGLFVTMLNLDSHQPARRRPRGHRLLWQPLRLGQQVPAQHAAAARGGGHADGVSHDRARVGPGGTRRTKCRPGRSPFRRAAVAGVVRDARICCDGYRVGIDHPPVDDRPLPRSRARLFWTVVASFILIFMPTPFRTNVGAAPKQEIAAPGGTR
jgi:hypothetical protein